MAAVNDLRGLAALLNPRSVAIVGATPRPDTLGYRPAINLATQGFAGRILPVNPRYDTINGARCYPDLLGLPEPPDVVLVVVGADRVFETLDQAVETRAGAAIVFGGGFAETGEAGADRQARLTTYRERGLRICGPNCNGIFNLGARTAMGFSPSFEREARLGRVALISQSGAIATGISSRGMETGIGFSHVVATGNEADLEVSDFIEYLVEDDGVGVFACFVEGLKDPHRFLRAAEAALAAGKPVIVLKAGRSESGRQVAQSHTGSMTGSYEVLAGALRQRGVVVVESLDDLLGAASLFATGARARPSAGIAVMSLSGGMAALTADQCDAAGVPLAVFGDGTRRTLRAALPDIAAVSNPLDVTGQVIADRALWTRCARAIAVDPAVDATLGILSILAGGADDALARDVRVIADEEPGLHIGVWASAAPPECGIRFLREAGVPTFLRSDDAVRAVAAWRHYWTTREARLSALAELGGALPGTPISASTADAWTLLEASGLPIARQVLLSDGTALETALAGLRFPLALKIQSDDILHKTELNLLRLGVRDLEEAREAFDELIVDARRHRPQARIDGVLIQEMVRGRREFILGLREEPLLGPAIVFGLGGIFSEVFSDVVVRVAPLSTLDAEEMLDGLQARELLGPVRGLGAVDRAMLVDVLMRFSGLAAGLARAGIAREFEINPLIVADDGRSCAAVDVLVSD